MKRKVLLHVDILKVLGKLRQDLPNNPRYRRSMGGAAPLEGPHAMMFLVGYDADEVLAALNDVVYKFDEEVC